MRKRCGGRARGPDEKEIRGQNGERQIFANKEKTNICQQGEDKYLPTRRRQILLGNEYLKVAGKKTNISEADRTGKQLAK